MYMVKITLQHHCSECGESFTETTHRSESDLLGRGIDLEKINDDQAANPIKVNINSCSGHAGLKRA